MLTTNYSQANVVLSGGISLPQPTSTQTPVYGSCTTAASGTTVYTVPAGKTFYCTGAMFYNAAAALADLNGFKIATGTAIATVFSGGILFKATEGTNIVVTSTAAGNTVGIWGYVV